MNRWITVVNHMKAGMKLAEYPAEFLSESLIGAGMSKSV